jgi:hypothetical protein
MSEQPAGTDVTAMRTQLALKQEIDRRLDELVREAGKSVHLLHDDRAMRENQLRNVVDVAMSTQSLDVVTNFIRYQMGRSGGNQAWRHSDFGHKVIQALEGREAIVQRLTNEVTASVYAAVPESNRATIRQEAQLRLMRFYLGYLNRWFYYGSKTGRWQDVEAATREEASNV